MSENGKSITAEREKSALRREIGVLRQTVWVLSLKLEGFSNATIAETVEIPENTVRQILERKQGDVVTLIEVATEIALHKDETNDISEDRMIRDELLQRARLYVYLAQGKTMQQIQNRTEKSFKFIQNFFDRSLGDWKFVSGWDDVEAIIPDPDVKATYLYMKKHYLSGVDEMLTRQDRERIKEAKAAGVSTNLIADKFFTTTERIEQVLKS